MMAARTAAEAQMRIQAELLQRPRGSFVRYRFFPYPSRDHRAGLFVAELADGSEISCVAVLAAPIDPDCYDELEILTREFSCLGLISEARH